MKKTLSILLVLGMLLGLMTGCGSEPAETAPASSTVEKMEIASSIPELESEEDLSSDSDAEEASVVEDIVEHLSYTVDLPLVEEEATITYWTSLDPRINDYLPAENVEEALLAYTEIRAKTGVHIHLQTVSAFAQSEQFNLLVATGDYPDIIYNAASMYPTSGSGAIADGVLMDVAPYVEEFAPNLWETIQSSNTLKMNLLDSEGQMASIPMLYKETGLENAGVVYRADWSEEFGIGQIDTLEQYHDYLVKAKNTYGAFAYNATPMGGTTFATLEGYVCQALGGYTGYYQMNGEVIYGPTQDEYRTYLETMRQWYAEGLFSENMLSMDMSQFQSGFGAGKYASTLVNGAPGIGELYLYAPNEDGSPSIAVGVLGQYTAEGVEQWLVSSENNPQKDGPWCLSTNCSDPELICRLVGWLYTEEGSLAATYGVEGVTYDLDENGDPQWTDMILHNSDGYNTTVTMNMYATANVPCLFDQRRTFVDYSQEQLAAVDVFKGEDVDRNNVPSGVASFLTTDEQTEMGNLRVDMETYQQEAELGFVTGAKEINDDTWQEYVDTMYNTFRLDRLLEINQISYDRYIQQLESIG